MANATATEVVLDRAPALTRRPPESLAAEAWRRFRKHRLAAFGAAILAVMVFAVLAGPLIYRVPINEIDFKAKLKGPSWAHPMGTDDLGQDILARMLYGGRISLDVLKKALGPEAGVFIMIVVVIGGLRWMPVARLVRAQFLSLREKEFVEAARSLGARPFRQVIRHILPNAVGPVIVAGTLDVAAAILAESTLSFLGLGFPPDIPTWGRILFDAKDNLDFAPHWAIFPGTAIFLTVLSINYLGGGLRDALDPRKVL